MHFSVLIYIGITIKLSIKDYQKDLSTYSTEYIINFYILIIRFKQLDRHFQALLLQLKANQLSKYTFNRAIEPIEYI